MELGVAKADAGCWLPGTPPPTMAEPRFTRLGEEAAGIAPAACGDIEL